MNYSDWVTAVSKETVIDTGNADFIAILPSAIDYAEGRIYRELNLLTTSVRDGTTQLVTNNRNVTLPALASGSWLIVDGANVITPNNTAPDSGTRNPLLKVTQSFVDNLATAGTTGLPAAFGMVTDTTFVVGPVPDNNYFIEVYGKIKPLPLSASNPNTALTLLLPDLFLAASMIFMTGYQQNYGAQSGDPKMGLSWESQYQALKGSADTEEMRKRLTVFNGRALGGTPRAA